MSKDWSPINGTKCIRCKSYDDIVNGICPNCHVELMAKALQSFEHRYYGMKAKNKNFKSMNNVLHKRMAAIENSKVFAHIIKIPKQRLWYIDVGLDKDYCSICLKKRKTTAHHIIPIRAECKNKMLRELRIRTCSKCEKKIHPENAFMPDKILRRKDKMIKELQEKMVKYESINVMAGRCLFWVNGYCNSDYARGMECNAKDCKNLPKRCPYPAQSIEEVKT